MSAKTGSKITRVFLGQEPELRREVMLSLKQTRYFAAISHEILEQVLSESYLLRLVADDVLIKEGSEEIDTFYFLREGSVGVYVDGKYLHSINEIGDAVGEIGVITHSSRTGDVIAEIASEMIEVPWGVIESLKSRDAERLLAFFNVIAIVLAEKLKTSTQRVHLFENFVQDILEGQVKSEEITAELKAKYEDLALSNENLKNLAIRDQMTNLFNHAEFKDNLSRQIKIYRRNQEPFCLVMGDLDNFKIVNDTHGHLVGDEVICNAASLLVGSLREEMDSVYRYGGEEFAVIMRNTSEPDGEMVMNRFRAAQEKSSVQANETKLTTTMSIGVGGFNPDWTMDRFIETVDQAMYRAKHKGKNRVVSVSEAMLLEASGEGR
ncbi:MAG: GGDEF domain-containing protein [SAR324 cluster bacterium]|nr:GGDEF domain-containing protein [SAR324 cluster bacterium]